MIKYSYDGEAQAAYILVVNNAVSDTVQIASSVYLDVSEDGRAVGIELLGLSVGALPPRLGEESLDILQARGVPPEVLEFLGRGTSGAQTAQSRPLVSA
jgi:uncharacterized protein YuzE